MLRDSPDRRDRAPRAIAWTLLGALALAGCGNEAPATGTVEPTKEALKRQNEMYNFMKEQGKKPKAPAIPKKVG